MKCPTCSFDNEAHAKFCINCGTVLVIDCPSCGHNNAPTARFCAACGLALAALSSEPAQLAPASASPIDSHTAREGMRKLVSILFSDLVDSTQLMAESDPEDAAARVEVMLATMRDAVARYDGTVNKVQGDGLMAIFGAPRPHEDHAVRACCAALAMHRALEALGPNWPAVRIGVHTGEAVVRHVATDLAPQFDAIGLTVHIAARVENAAPANGIAVSEATALAARDQIAFDPLGAYQVKGLSQPLALYTPRRIRSLVASEQFRGGQSLASFTGRAAEMTVLEEALAQAADGNGCCVAIEGEPGLGKSRLAFEFIESCRRRGLPVIEARATAEGRVAPYQTALALLRALVGIDAGTPAPEAAGRTLARLRDLGETDANETGLLLDFLGLPRPEADAEGAAKPAGDAAGRRARLMALAGRLVVAAGRTHAVIVAEDLHWLDASSEPFLETLAEALPRTAILLLCNFRPGYRAAWLDWPFCRRLVLRPLGGDALAQLVEERLADHPGLRQHRDAIAAKAGGNPFFAEELVRELADRALAGAGDRLAELPDSVRGTVEARVDRLQESDRNFLRAAAVIGRDFGIELVREIANIGNEEALASVSRLLDGEMLYERSALGGALAFKHPLVQEVTYNAMLRRSRAELHRRCAFALAKDSAHDDSRAALTAYHWEQSGDTAQAAANYVKAALWAAPRAPAHALESWRAVRRLLDGGPRSTQADYMRMMACGQIVNLAWREGLEGAEVVSAVEDALGLARHLADARAAVLIRLAYGRFLAARGSADDYLTHADAAMAEAEGTGDPSLTALVRAIRSHALLMTGDVTQGLDANVEALAIVDRIAARDLQTLGYNVRHWLTALRARLLLLAGRLPDVPPQVDQVLSDPTVDALHRTMTLAVAAELAGIEGRPQAAQVCATEIEAAAREAPTPYLRVLALRCRGAAAQAAGEPAQATALFAEALALSRRHRAGLEVEPQILVGLAETL
ncbi:MAG: AAA family ATPase, partial [Alphaproteobacteria bacterium]|nr:AAA family ATPase [Alphaproteobacteria bacterium]